MKDAEKVTFGGSGLDRAAHLRGDVEKLAQRDGANWLVFWRGKPLVSGENRDRLTRLSADHPLLAEFPGPDIFVGLEDDVPVFARDISVWEPEYVDLSELNSFRDASEQFHPLLTSDQRFCELRNIMTMITARDAEMAAAAKAVFSWHRSHKFCALCGHESVMAMGGWQRDCPDCGGHHFPRTDPVVIMLITRGNDLLLGRSPGWPEGMYSLLAGFVEPGEPIEAAVRREVFEESGIRVGAVEYLSSQPWPFPSSLMFGCRGEALPGDITVDENELEDAFWISREDLALAFDGRHPKIKAARKGAIAHFLMSKWLADELD